MTTFKSEDVTVNRNKELIFNLLSDFRNFENIMPPQVSDWQTDGEHCSFNIQNMATLGMRFEQKIPYSHIMIVSEGKSPFAFNLNCHLKEIDVNTTIVSLVLNADLNMMLKMIASKPLANFVNILAVKIKEECETRLPEQGENNLL